MPGEHYQPPERIGGILVESLDALVARRTDIDGLHPNPIGTARDPEDATKGSELWNRYLADRSRKNRNKVILGRRLGFFDEQIPTYEQLGRDYGMGKEAISQILDRELIFIRRMIGVEEPPPRPKTDYQTLLTAIKDRFGEPASFGYTIRRRRPIHETDAVVWLPQQREVLEELGITTLEALGRRTDTRLLFERGKTIRQRMEELEAIREIRRQIGKGQPLIVAEMSVVADRRGNPMYEYTTSDGYIINPRLKSQNLNELNFLNLSGPKLGLLKKAGYYHIKDLLMGLLDDKTDLYDKLRLIGRQELFRTLVKFFRIKLPTEDQADSL